MVNIYEFKGRGLEPGSSQILSPILKNNAMVVTDLHVCRSQNAGGEDSSRGRILPCKILLKTRRQLTPIMLSLQFFFGGILMNMRCPPNTRLQMYPKYLRMQISCYHKTQGVTHCLQPHEVTTHVSIQLVWIWTVFFVQFITIFGFFSVWGNPFHLKLLLLGAARANFKKASWMPVMAASQKVRKQKQQNGSLSSLST